MSKGTKYWPLRKALEEAKKRGVEVSRPTLIKWIEKYNLGFQLGDKGGKWYLHPQKFLRYINNDGNNTKGKKDSNSDPVSCETGSANEKQAKPEKRKSPSEV